VQGGLNLRLGLAIGGRDFLGCAIGAGNELQHVGLGLIRMSGDLRAQILLSVIGGILDE